MDNRRTGELSVKPCLPRTKLDDYSRLNMRLDTQGGDVERRFVELGLAVEARAMPVVCPKTTKRHGID
jgi:hypothetical protein